MHIILKNAIFATIAISILTPNLISCYSVTRQIKNPPIIHSRVPIESFILVEIFQKISPVGCSKQEKFVECLKFIEKLPEITNKSTGSGMLISHNGKRLVITAAHVCIGPEIKETTYGGFKILLSATSTLKINLQGGASFKTQIINSDSKVDLCSLKPPPLEKSPRPIQLAASPPARGDKIINIAAPLGITGKNLTLIFDGRYAGFHRGWHYYTIPARPGSSGSIILNENFQAVGTVNVAVVGLESAGIGCGWYELKKFLKKK